MISVEQQTINYIKKVARNKNNKFINILRRTNNTTEISRIALGKTTKDRDSAIHLLKSMVPEGCGELFCTFT